MRFVRQSSLAVAIAATSRDAFGDSGPMTPLARAARRGNLAALTSLLRAGARAGDCDPFGGTALHWAARGSAAPLAIVDALLDAGADIDARDRRPIAIGRDSGWTPLHVALSHAQTAIVARLLERGADPAIESDHGLSPRDLANAASMPRDIRALFRTAAIREIRR